MMERIRERFKIKLGVPVEVERTVVPLEYYRELQRELERLKD